MLHTRYKSKTAMPRHPAGGTGTRRYTHDPRHYDSCRTGLCPAKFTPAISHLLQVLGLQYPV